MLDIARRFIRWLLPDEEHCPVCGAALEECLIDGQYCRACLLREQKDAPLP